MPFILLIVLPALFSFGIIYLEYYLLCKWWYFHNLDNQLSLYYMVAAVLIIVLSVFGRILIAKLLSDDKVKEIEPDEQESNITHTLLRPDGSKLKIQIMGDIQKPAILLIHGWNSSNAEWFYQKKHFSKNYKVIVYDLPGLP